MKMPAVFLSARVAASVRDTLLIHVFDNSFSIQLELRAPTKGLTGPGIPAWPGSTVLASYALSSGDVLSVQTVFRKVW